MEVLKVSSLVPASGRFSPTDLLFSLDSPAPDATLEGYCMEVRGWVVGAEQSVDHVELEIAGQPAQRIPANLPRPDVATALGNLPASARSGFTTWIDVLGLPRESQLTLRAVQGDTTVPLCAIQWHRTPLRSAFQPSLHPLSLVSMGRMGTTWLMSLLGEHPAIVVHRHFPYELHAGLYWMRLFTLLAAPGPLNLPTGNIQLPPAFDWLEKDPRNCDLHKDFGLPLITWIKREYVESMLYFCQHSIESFYRHLIHGQTRAAARYFAEKGGPKPILRLMREAYPLGRQIFLVRDFRDMYCSVHAFNASRGFPAFKRDRVGSDEEHILALAREANDLSDYWHEQKESSLLVHYEDLVDRPVECLQRIFNYLELDSAVAEIRDILARSQQRTAEFPAHRTSPSPENSIGRWRHFLSPQLRSLCEQAFRAPLAGFGYNEAGLPRD
jgi:hypothetical protein